MCSADSRTHTAARKISLRGRRHPQNDWSGMMISDAKGPVWLRRSTARTKANSLTHDMLVALPSSWRKRPSRPAMPFDPGPVWQGVSAEGRSGRSPSRLAFPTYGSGCPVAIAALPRGLSIFARLKRTLPAVPGVGIGAVLRSAASCVPECQVFYPVMKLGSCSTNPGDPARMAARDCPVA